MNQKSYDITNLVMLSMIAAGTYRLYGPEVALIIIGALGLALNLVMLFVATRKK